MTKIIQNGIGPQGGSPQVDKFLDPSTLSTMWKGRYHIWSPVFGTRTMKFLECIQPRSKRNGYEVVADKVNNLRNLAGNQLKYVKGLTSNFGLGIPLNVNTIMEEICSTRAVFGLEPFKGRNIQQQCLNEFYSLFIVNEKPGKNSNGRPDRSYTPVFALLP